MAGTRAAALLAAILAGAACPPPPEASMRDREICDPPAQPSAEPTAAAAAPEAPPPTRRQPIVDDLHGVPVADPYRWLEDGADPEVRAWLAAQDAYARARLAALPGGDGLRARLAELLYVDAISAPLRRGERVFYSRRHHDREKAIYYVRDGDDGPERVLLDPNALSPDGSVAVSGLFPSRDGRYAAYRVNENNADAATLKIRDVAAGRDLPVEIADARYAAPSWTPDGAGFYYVGLPRDPAIPPAELPGRAEVRFHRIGEGGGDDRVIAPATGDAARFVGVHLARDGRFLFITHQHGWSRTDVYFRDMSEGSDTVPPDPAAPAPGFRALIAGQPANYGVLAWRGALYVHTDEGAPRYRVFKVDPARPERAAWREIVPESDATLEGLQIIGERLALAYLRDARSEVVLADLDGARQGAIPLPDLGSASELVGDPDDPRAYLYFTSFADPGRIFEVDVARGDARLWAAIDAPIDRDAFLVEQLRYPSRDGTEVTMFVVRRRDTPLDGDRPLLLYGYGGFAVSLTPAFSARAAVWVERGGVYAVANLRGGGEYGEEWHRAGMRERKQNAFDDFAAAAEALVARGYTRPERLAVMGGSNGGLLVGATLTQRPELARAVVCAVPLLDMVRYHRFGAGRTWIPEYGDPDLPDEFAWLYAYSPYHHVPEDRDLPALLMLASDSDDRVDPMHARKFTAEVQRRSRRPAWLRVEANAGHGGADLVRQTIAREADTLAFLAAELDPDGSRLRHGSPILAAP